MPSLETARRIAAVKNNGAKTIGQIHKENSDWIMDYTWDSDIQSKICYIYDYDHDDFFVDEFGIKRSLAENMSYENTNKTRIDAKFIVKTYQSMDKDQVEYYVQLRPSQKLRFDENDELFYFEQISRRYNSEFPVGLFLDIPDDKGVYKKWLVCRTEPANQFPKYLVLPVNYELMWIEANGNERIKRRMWSVLRMQSSYTIGVYTDHTFTHLDNQNKVWLPMNSITEKIWYTNDESQSMRVIVSTLMEHPSVWKITKCENVQPFGIQKLTIYSDAYNEHTDYVNLETGEMYANYFTSPIEPISPSENNIPISSNTAKITASTSTIKIGGSYKTLSVASILDENGVDIIDRYSDATFTWYCSIDGIDFTNNKDVITWLDGSTYNRKKLKFCKDRSYLQKVLDVKCVVTKNGKNIEATMQFELIV